MKTVEMYHIDRQCRAVTQRTFPVRWLSTGGECVTDIFSSRTVNGSDADLFTNLLDRAFIQIEDLTLCGHYPNYGLRCFDGDKLTLETTVCLSCANWIGFIGAGAARFCIDPEVFPELSFGLQRLLPLSAAEALDLQRVSEMQRLSQERNGNNT
jgi:hypothetical protein